MTGAVTVNAGANIAPGNGGNNTAILTTGPLTLASTSNFRVDINGTTAGTGYDRLSVATGGVTTTSQSGQHCRPGRHFSFWTKSPGAALPATLRGSHKGYRGGQRRYRFPGHLQLRQWQRHRAPGGRGAGPRTEHIDRRCACDRWARFHSASQIAEGANFPIYVPMGAFKKP